MPNTELKSTSDQRIDYDEYRQSKNMNIPFRPTVKFKERRTWNDKLKSIGEELLSWLLIILAITLLVQIFSNLE